MFCPDFGNISIHFRMRAASALPFLSISQVTAEAGHASLSVSPGTLQGWAELKFWPFLAQGRPCMQIYKKCRFDSLFKEKCRFRDHKLLCKFVLIQMSWSFRQKKECYKRHWEKRNVPINSFLNKPLGTFGSKWLFIFEIPVGISCHRILIIEKVWCVAKCTSTNVLFHPQMFSLLLL